MASLSCQTTSRWSLSSQILGHCLSRNEQNEWLLSEPCHSWMVIFKHWFYAANLYATLQVWALYFLMQPSLSTSWVSCCHSTAPSMRWVQAESEHDCTSLKAQSLCKQSRVTSSRVMSHLLQFMGAFGAPLTAFVLPSLTFNWVFRTKARRATAVFPPSRSATSQS